MSQNQQLSPAPIDTRAFRNALGRFATGVTVVATVHDAAIHGMTANAFTSVSLDPPLVLVAIDQRTRMQTLLTDADRYSVSILAREQEELAQHFAGKPRAGYDESGFVWWNGMPVISGAIAHLICRIVDAHAAGDHTLYIGEVEHFAYQEGDPLIFYRGAFGRLEIETQSHDWLPW